MNCRNLILSNTPEFVYNLLISIGKSGEKTGVPAYVVGGFIRDLLVGRRNLDIDIVVEGEGINFARQIAEKINGKIKTHDQFGTAVVILPDGFKIDFATARTEVYEYPGALPTVNPASIKDDLYRRDFTINSMAVKLTGDFGELVDCFNGQRDLKYGYIRILHDLSFQDDPTRMFRAVRYEKRYDFSIEKHTQELLQQAVSKGYLENISRQRIRNELFLILSEDNPLPAIQRVEELGLLKYIHPCIEIYGDIISLFDKIGELSKSWDQETDLVLVYLLALLDQLHLDKAIELSEDLVLQSKYTDALIASKIKIHNISELNGNLRNSIIYNAFKDISSELVLYFMAKFENIREAALYYINEIKDIKPILTGRDLLEVGYPKGPIYSEILDRVFSAQLDGIISDRKQALEYVKKNFFKE
ncbi:hypothetical protein GF312_09225 [Candidatus Poribacteria bacterium]|nr:hypothetical protein [Candidatus Poribacteria bacterium]